MFENIKKFWKYFIVNEESEISKEKDEKCEIKNINEETEIDELTSQIVDMIINEEINLVIVI